MQRYHKEFSTKATPQSQPIPGKKMTANSAGGFSFAVDCWRRLDRFLILGADAPTYYIDQPKLVRENAQAVADCIAANGPETVKRIVEISERGRAPKNDPALFALAMCAGIGDQETKNQALDALRKVARIGTHLFHFLEYCKGFRGWGRNMRKAVADWYTTRSAKSLAHQAVKYRQRDGWTHRDALRKCHAVPPSESHNRIFYWITQGWEAVGEKPHDDENLLLPWAYERAQKADKKELVRLISEYGLPWEAIPSEHLKDPDVWAALLPSMPMTATMRNLGRLSSIGLLTQRSAATKIVVERFADREAIAGSRIHPFNVLVGMRTYQRGQGFKGSLSWNAIGRIVDALDGLFYAAFGNVEPSGKSLCLALDISGSMSGASLNGSQVLNCREASAAMAMVTARAESDYSIVGFSDRLVELPISPRQRLDDVVKAISDLPFGATDCALPMLWAMGVANSSGRMGWGGRCSLPTAKAPESPIDGFVIYTDSETWCGKIHPVQALAEYRRRANPAAKLVVVGMASNGFSIADPNDGGMLDVVGFDTAAPQVISDFVRGQ